MPPLDRSRKRPRRAPGDSGAARRARWRVDVRGLTAQDRYDATANASAARAQIEELQPHAPGVPGGTNWTPIGPAGALRGQTRNRATVSGRINAIEVGPLGRRAYLVAADGGVWAYEKVTVGGIDHDTWLPMNDFVMSPSMVNLASANSLSCHALLVRFGANALADTLYVGTGEPDTIKPTPPQPGSNYFGIGILVSPGGGGPRTWHLEAPNLAGQAVYRLVADPDNPAIIWAATSAGLFTRPAAAVANTPWVAVGSGAAPLLPGNREISDVVITGTTVGGDKTIFAAARGGAAAAPTRTSGVYASTDNGANWDLVPISPASAANPGRIALAVSDANQVVYRFDQPGRLWRFDSATTQFVQVTNTPPAGQLVGSQGDYDLVVAVQPGTDNTVYLAGNLVKNDNAGPLNPGEWELSLYRSAMAVAANGVGNFGYTSGGNPDASPLWIGAGIHPDGHMIAFARDAAGTALSAGEVWVGCDGGVFRSTAGGALGTFTPVNETLSITQPSYFDHHPTSEAIVVTGSQDNGTLRGDGSAIWRLIRTADGGGVAIDPHNPLRVMAQYTNASLFSMQDGGLSGANRAAGPTLSTGENPKFYSRLTTSPAVEPDTTLIYTTNRVWASYNWGASWRVLPANLTPAAAGQTLSRLNGAADMVSDVVWIAQNRFHASTGQLVFRFDRTTRNANHNTDVWTSPPTQLPATGLPAVRAITSLGVVNPATDDLYVGLGGVNTGNDHVWWYDSTPPGNWRTTTFGPGMTIGGVVTPFDAPVTALVVDPANTNFLYVGTDVGVFQGQRSAVPPFAWTWRLWSRGLPEAGVIDLKIHGPSRRLRASLHGRGIWEYDLTNAVTRSPDVYLRMNAADSGRHLPTARGAAHPYQPTPRTVDWTMSPDIKVRRTATAAQAPPAYPGTTLQFQTPRLTGANVTRWQAHAQRRGFSTAPDVGGTFDAGSRQAARDIQSRYGLTAWNGALASDVIDGVVGQRTWAAATSYPPLPVPVTPGVFADQLGEDFDQTTDLIIGDADANDVFVQVHDRGDIPILAGQLRVLLLVAASDPAGAVPQLPADYAAKIRANDANPNWLTASGWQFADAGVYRTNVVELNQRQPVVVSWTVDFTALGFAAGDHVMLVALASATSAAVGAADNQIRSVERNLQTLVEGAGAAAGEVKVAARLVRLDAVAAIP